MGLDQDDSLRLDFLLGVVSILRSSYTEIAIRRWFERPRKRWSGRSPAEHLADSWSPSGAAAREVLGLARETLI